MNSTLSSYSLRLSIMETESQRLEAIGQIACGVAHDLNDMLTTIIGYTDLSLRQVGPENPLRHNLEETKRAAERAATLVRQLQLKSSSKSRQA